jgi:hypothetical protein
LQDPMPRIFCSAKKSPDRAPAKGGRMKRFKPATPCQDS